MNNHRGRSVKPQRRPVSTHKATAGNQVWMWDITWLPGAIKGLYFYLYLIIDLYSRKVVGWEIWPEESFSNASHRHSGINYLRPNQRHNGLEFKIFEEFARHSRDFSRELVAKV